MNRTFLLTLLIQAVTWFSSAAVAQSVSQPESPSAFSCVQIQGNHRGRLSRVLQKISDRYSREMDFYTRSKTSPFQGILQCEPSECRFRKEAFTIPVEDFRRAATDPRNVVFSEGGIDFSINYQRQTSLDHVLLGTDPLLIPQVYKQMASQVPSGVVMRFRRVAIIINEPESLGELWVCQSLSDYEVDFEETTFLSGASQEDLHEDLKDIEESFENQRLSFSELAEMNSESEDYVTGDSDFNQPLFGLPLMSLQDKARVLGNPDLQMHVVRMSAAALVASAGLLSYRLLALGGRQKALASLVPPGYVEGLFGRQGIRVPPHETYSLQDVENFAAQLRLLESQQEIDAFLQAQNPELIAYFNVVVEYVRRAEAMQRAVDCPNPNLCA